MLEWLTALVSMLGDAIGLAMRAMAFDAHAFQQVAASDRARLLALLAVFFAGVSQALGHSVVLFLNRVGPWRLCLSLALTGGIYLAAVLVTATCILLASTLIADVGPGFGAVFGVIALAFAPRLLGLMTLAPYLGETVDHILDTWVLVLVIFGLQAGLAVPLWLAAGAAGLGWAIAWASRLLFGAPLSRLIAAMRRITAGRSLDLEVKSIAAFLIARARSAARGGRKRR